MMYENEDRNYFDKEKCMDFKKASLAELRAYAKEKGIKNISGMKKQELSQLLQEVDLMLSHQAEMRHKAAKPEETKSVVKPETKSETTDETEKKDSAPEEKAEKRPVGRPRMHTDRNGERQDKAERTSSRSYSHRSDAARQDAGDDSVKSESTANMEVFDGQEYNPELDSGEMADGILEVMADGYGFIRTANYLPGDRDIYVSPMQIRRFGLKKGDILTGPIKVKTQSEKFSALLYIKSNNGMLPSEAAKRKAFEELTPIFPNERISLDTPGAPVAIRIVDLLSPIGKGQRGMIVSPPKAGKTTLLKAIAKSISRNNKDMHMIVLLIDERPEEVTDIKESIEGSNVEVIYSTFDELPEHHRRVSEMVIERAKRLVEHKKDVVILLDSITRLARAYNLTVAPSGRTLSGGLDPAALHMPKRFFGAARNMREGGSLTILATALVETGSRMDDVVFEEFKGTGNMELVLDRKLSEKRIFPAIDIAKSGTRRDDLLLNDEEQEAVDKIHKMLTDSKADETTSEILKIFVRTKNNREFLDYFKKTILR
jgi:transcription termination factor Rho